MAGEEIELGCARPTGGLVGAESGKSPGERKPEPKEEVRGSMVSVGKKAPDFEAPGYHEGRFKKIKLSEYLGKWVVLCFYPGDFTFV
ncbi:MAG: redoxin domain-containing protein [Deltaproteobacteria bacterium]|nr:redoxin domain-containing protein [Deltaproteobacteria bacterium]